MALSRPPHFLFCPLFHCAVLCVFLSNSHHKPPAVSFNAFACCESWTMRANSLPAPCPTRNQAGGGQPLNHRMTLSETTAHSFAALQSCGSTVADSKFGSKVYWKVSTLLLCIRSLCFAPEGITGIIPQNNWFHCAPVDGQQARHYFSTKEASHTHYISMHIYVNKRMYTHIMHVQRITVCSIFLWNLRSWFTLASRWLPPKLKLCRSRTAAMHSVPEYPQVRTEQCEFCCSTEAGWKKSASNCTHWQWCSEKSTIRRIRKSVKKTIIQFWIIAL